MRKAEAFGKGRDIHFFFYKQLVYKQPQAQIAKNLSTLLSTLSASDLVVKVTIFIKLLLVTKNMAKKCQDYANLLMNFFRISFKSLFRSYNTGDYFKLKNTEQLYDN